MTKTLGPAGIKALESRGLNIETATKLGIYTVSHLLETKQDIPDERGRVVAFPFIEHGREVATKYRAPGKKFWSAEGGKRTFFNSDVMDDTALESGLYKLVITEGEIDCLTSIDCGFPHSVSVPDGAPQCRDGEDPKALEPFDPSRDVNGKFAFVFNNRHRLAKIKYFILAVDNDLHGQRLAAELVRRLRAARCFFVTYPEGCKDLNDVLLKHGADDVRRVIMDAKPYPVRGLFRLNEYPDVEPLKAVDPEMPGMDGAVKLFPGQFMVVTGVPSHGKSTWVLNLAYRMALNHRWTSAICSPEMPAIPVLRDRLRQMKLGRQPMPVETETIKEVDEWINNFFVFIDIDPPGAVGEGEEVDFTLEWIVERAEHAVDAMAAKILIIDPWNEIEHARGRGENVTDYVARAIRLLKRFARERGVVVIVVAHPTKEVLGKDGKTRTPSLYDIESSAAWYNKADHGIIIERPNPDKVDTRCLVKKVRFEETGRRAVRELLFNLDSRLFEPGHNDSNSAKDVL